MRRTADDRSPSWRTRAAMTLSLLAGAGVVAAALVAPGLPTGGPAAAPTADGLDSTRIEAARTQAALVAQEDDRLLTQLRAVPWNVGPYVDRDHGAPALILTPSRSPYGLASLVELGAATRVGPDTVALTTSVLVAPGADLVLDAPGTTLRMTSGAAGFTSLVGWKGSLELTGDPARPMTVRSWDPATGGPDRTAADGRAYLRVVGGELRTTDVELADLGFWSGRTGGLALTGVDGAAATGSLTATRVRGGHYGLYSETTADLVVDGSTFEGSTVDGVLLHRGSVGTTVADSTAAGNGGSGVAADRGASEVTVRAVVAESNAADGIRIDGRPPAEQPGPAGMSLDGHTDFRVLDSTARSNRGSGVLVWDADDVLVRGNTVSDNAEGVVVRGAAERVRLDTNAVSRSAGMGIAVRDGAGSVEVADNAVSGAQTGVQVRDSVVAVHDNRVTEARVHGLSFQGAVGGSSAERNVLAGQGAGSVDLRRVGVGASVGVAGNLDGDWLVVRSGEQRVHDLLGSSPLLLLWAGLFLVPVVATALTRRRARAATPYAPRAGNGPRTVMRQVERRRPAPREQATTDGSDTRVTVVGLG